MEPASDVYVDQPPAKDRVAYHMLLSVPITMTCRVVPSLTMTGDAIALSGTGVLLDVSHVAAHAPLVKAL